MHMTHGKMAHSPRVPMQEMAAELWHWRSGYPHRPYFSEGLQFERYLPTFAFAYQAFLPELAREPGKVPARLCSIYKDSMPAIDRIDWHEAEMIISATWTRMHIAAQAQEIKFHHYAEAHYAKRLPLSPTQNHAP